MRRPLAGMISLDRISTDPPDYGVELLELAAKLPANHPHIPKILEAALRFERKKRVAA